MLHVKKDELVLNKWSGGTTTQLFIYPKESSYKKLDFIFRISTATIDEEESTFTILPNINRTLMILNGEIIIQHKNKYTKQLKKFDIDNFSGDWQTTSMGKATDFNIMTTGSALGTAQGLSLKENEQWESQSDADFILLYLYSGKLKASENIINKGDVLITQREKISVEALSLSEIALASIKL